MARLETAHPDALRALAGEIVEWRIADYLDRARRERDRDARAANSSLAFVCKVGHAGGRPIVFPLDRKRYPEIPTGWTEILVGDERFKANFVKVALNVVRRNDRGPNVLSGILRDFFGEQAGLPGTRHYVGFEREGKWIRMRKWEEDEDEES